MLIYIRTFIEIRTLEGLYQFPIPQIKITVIYTKNIWEGDAQKVPKFSVRTPWIVS